MRTSKLLRANLGYYWRTNLAMLLGVATAVAVLAGALLVGDSVKASLRDLFVQRLGSTDYVVTAQGFFREQLAADIQNHAQFSSSGLIAACPLIAIEGSVTNETNKQVGSRIRVYGIDERFWTFHARPNAALGRNEILVSESLARELSSGAGDQIVLRVEKPSAIPIESLHSRKDDLGATLRLSVKAVLAPDALGEFSLQPQQGAVRAVFVPLHVLQDELGQAGKSNLILVDETASEKSEARVKLLEQILKDTATLEDYGIKLRVLNQQKELSVESFSGLVPDEMAKQVDAAAQSSRSSGGWPFLSYLVNGIRRDDGREIPYSIVTGVEDKMLEWMQHNELGHMRGCDASAGVGAVPATANLPPLLLNQWAASDLQVKIGDRVTLDYYLWRDEGKLDTASTAFRVSCILPMKGLALDRDLVPDYPGITESESFSDWDPPFPIDLKRVRPQDEHYWKEHRTAPKGFVPIEVAQELWGSRFGKLTSLRIEPKDASLEETNAAFTQSLRKALDPAQNGFAILPVRAQGLEASRGATDFGEYFLYFSFFLVVSALLLAALFFKLGIEQRLREIGLLQAVGFPPRKIRSLFLIEGIAISIAGGLIGIVGALAYAQLMMVGLRTWWVDAVGTTMLRLHVSPLSLSLGVAGGIVAALICIIWTLRRTGKQSTRSLLAGVVGDAGRKTRTGKVPRLSFWFGTAFGIAALALLIASALNLIGQVAGFFGGGTTLLIALLCFQSAWLRRPHRKIINGGGWWPVSRLGFRSATSRPGRSVLCIALIASAAFIIVAVDAFRHREGSQTMDKKSGTGGYPLLAESLLPVVHDPNNADGRTALNLTADGSLSNVSFARFRVRPGDDASCLNLYRPANPKILGLTPDFIGGNRFKFQKSLAASPEEHSNNWLLLNRKFDDGAVPVMADANSMAYVLHVKLGDDFVLNLDSGQVRLRFVGSLADSIFQSELLMSEENFVRLFPDQQGYRFFLVDTPSPSETASLLEERLSDFGFDAAPTAERLANFHRVENTYLSTFQMLGGLGLLLGTLGMAAVLLRNVLERRRELALLRAVGYNSGHFTLMVVAENVLLLLCGLLTGCLCALLAIAPVFLTRHAQLPGISLGVLLAAVLLCGLAASIIATWAALRSPLLPALRAE